MKAEKKLEKIVLGGDLVSPLLLEDIKSRVKSQPLEESETKKAKMRHSVKSACKTALSACAVFVVCFFSFFLVLPLFMRAGSPMDSSAPVYLDELTEDRVGEAYIPDILDDLTAELPEWSTNTLLFLNGKCDFSKLYYDNELFALKSVYDYREKTVTIVECLSFSVVKDYQSEIQESELVGNGELYEGSFVYYETYKTPDGTFIVVLQDSRHTAYIMTGGNYFDHVVPLLEEIAANLKTYD